MADLLIPDLDKDLDEALSERAAEMGVSPAEEARRLLREALGAPVKYRDISKLKGFLTRDMSAEELAAFNAIDWEAPLFTDEELDQFMEDEEARLKENRF